MQLLSSVCLYLQVLPGQGLFGGWVGEGGELEKTRGGRGVEEGSHWGVLDPAPSTQTRDSEELNLATEEPARGFVRNTRVTFYFEKITHKYDFSSMPCANPLVHLLNSFSLGTVPPLISLPIWGQRCSFIHNRHFCPCQVCKSPEKAPRRVRICSHLSSSLAGEQCAVYPSLTLYELTICFIIGMIVMHILKKIKREKYRPLQRLVCAV